MDGSLGHFRANRTALRTRSARRLIDVGDGLGDVTDDGVGTVAAGIQTAARQCGPAFAVVGSIVPAPDSGIGRLPWSRLGPMPRRRAGGRRLVRRPLACAPRSARPYPPAASGAARSPRGVTASPGTPPVSGISGTQELHQRRPLRNQHDTLSQPARLPQHSSRTPAPARDLGPPRRSGLRLPLERRDL